MLVDRGIGLVWPRRDLQRDVACVTVQGLALSFFQLIYSALGLLAPACALP
jgi:hypothetical protein